MEQDVVQSIENRIKIAKCKKCNRMISYKEDDPSKPKNPDEFLCRECKRLSKQDGE